MERPLIEIWRREAGKSFLIWLFILFLTNFNWLAPLSRQAHWDCQCCFCFLSRSRIELSKCCPIHGCDSFKRPLSRCVFLVIHYVCSFYDSKSYFSFFRSFLNSSASLSSKKWSARPLTSASPWQWNARLCLLGISMGSNAENALSTGRGDLNLLSMFLTRALMYFWRSPWPVDLWLYFSAHQLGSQDNHLLKDLT